MLYLSQMLGKPVTDATGEEIGTINDVAIATGEVFPRVTSLAFQGPDKTPFMISWRKFVERFDDDGIGLNVAAPDIRFSYLQPDEVLLARDLLNKQIVDTQGKKVVRVNDLKLSESRNQLRLLGADVGSRGILRGLHPALETTVARAARLVGTQLPENIIPWNYMDLLDRDLSQVQLSVTHKRLHELHPADLADILETLSPSQRAGVFQHLENTQAAETISELEDELQADVIDDLSERRASDLLAEMDPDDAADIIGDLPYDKAEKLLRLMGIAESTAIRKLLGYKEKTAGGIMTPEVTTVHEDMTVQQVIECIRTESAEHESIFYVYVTEDRRLTGVLSLRQLIMASPETIVTEIAERDVIKVDPDDDQEDVVETMSKYDLLALPVVDENGVLLGIVTVDDALDVLEEEADEDLELATGRRGGLEFTGLWNWVSRDGWLFVWAIVWLALAYTVPLADFWAKAGFELSVPLILPAVIMLPFLLRLAEDIAAHTVSRLIEDAPEETFRRRLGRDAVSGLVLGVAGAVLGGVLFALVNSATITSRLAIAYALPAGVTLLAAVLTGTVLAEVGRRRAREERRLPTVVVYAVLAGLSLVLYVLLLELTFNLLVGSGVIG